MPVFAWQIDGVSHTTERSIRLMLFVSWCLRVLSTAQPTSAIDLGNAEDAEIAESGGKYGSASQQQRFEERDRNVSENAPRR